MIDLLENEKISLFNIMTLYIPFTCSDKFSTDEECTIFRKILTVKYKRQVNINLTRA